MKRVVGVALDGRPQGCHRLSNSPLYRIEARLVIVSQQPVLPAGTACSTVLVPLARRVTAPRLGLLQRFFEE